MKVYRLKKLIDGKYIKQQGFYAPVPDHDYNSGITYDEGETFAVEVGVQRREFANFAGAVTYRTFTDHHGRGKYKLAYFKWPDE